MPKQVEKILKCNPGEKSIKAAFAIYLDLSVLLGQCLQDVHLIKKKKKKLIIVVEKIALRNYVKN